MVGVAQLVRAPGCDSGGRGFETHHPPHFCIGLSPPLKAGWVVNPVNRFCMESS